MEIKDELILAYKRDDTTNRVYVRNRNSIENDPNFTQCVSYGVIMKKNNSILTYKRSNKEDNRLSDLYSIGFGGHIGIIDCFDPELSKLQSQNRIDIIENRINNSFYELKDYAESSFYREVLEEIGILCYNSRFYGLIEIGDTEIDKLHVGFIFVDVKENDFDLIKSQTYVNCEKDVSKLDWVNINDFKDINLESWSRYLLSLLK